MKYALFFIFLIYLAQFPWHTSDSRSFLHLYVHLHICYSVQVTEEMASRSKKNKYF